MKNTVQLITYADRLGDGTIASMTDILRTRFNGVYDGVHILPFFTPFDGADAGFDPIDHTKVDPRLGSWDDVAELSTTHDIMVDAIVNHMSWESAQFQDVLKNGENSEYYPMFLTMSSVFPNGATEEDLAGIYRPRPGLPFTHYNLGGKTRLVWVSFTPQQVDIDTDSAKGWEYLMSIFDQMAASHVRYIRLDAVGYGAKEAGTSCFMTPKTFKLISRLREEGVKRGLEILIEVHSYYKKQVEIASKVDRVYDFALPPLLLHSLFTGHVEPVAHWTEIRPNNAVTVLDTHDGIGVIDIGSDQLDYVGALAGRNDMELLRRTNNGRDINRHYYSTAEIDENLERPVVKALNALAKFRNELSAFDGEFSYEVDGDTSITFRWTAADGASTAALTFEPGRGLGTDNTTPVASLAWSDAAGDHETRDLLANPPIADID